jgi:hypothetical protein
MIPGRHALSALACAISVACLSGLAAHQAPPPPPFSVLAFSTGRNDHAHISFVQEANRWFPEIARAHDFRYESTTDWTRLNTDSLKGYRVVVFLDTRPEGPAQRDAFRRYMNGGGAWLGFHFSAFALTPSDYPQNWDWYQEIGFRERRRTAFDEQAQQFERLRREVDIASATDHLPGVGIEHAVAKLQLHWPSGRARRESTEAASTIPAHCATSL